MHDDARRAILARRAAFLSSALAAMSCSPKQPDAPPGPGPAAPSALVTTTSPDLRAPDLSPPPDTRPDLVKKYDALRLQLAETERFYDDLEAAIPAGCGPTEASCAEAWQALAVKIDEERYTMSHGLWSTACADAAPEVKAYHERVGRWRDYRFARRERFEEKLNATLGAFGDSSADAFSDMLAAARKAKPMPCLSPPPCTR